MTKDEAISLLQRHERARQGRLRAKVNKNNQELEIGKYGNLFMSVNLVQCLIKLMTSL